MLRNIKVDKTANDKFQFSIDVPDVSNVQSYLRYGQLNELAPVTPAERVLADISWVSLAAGSVAIGASYIGVNNAAGVIDPTTASIDGFLYNHERVDEFLDSKTANMTPWERFAGRDRVTVTGYTGETKYMKSRSRPLGGSIMFINNTQYR